MTRPRKEGEEEEEERKKPKRCLPLPLEDDCGGIGGGGSIRWHLALRSLEGHCCFELCDGELASLPPKEEDDDGPCSSKGLSIVKATR